ncbi:hypothetical protein ACFKHW_28935 [Bradyrhizobium lupini]|uniref:hypothetical protein n=1 Tax=Rhizobium lupini TaxID=136996 RepID=UPI0036723478
MWKGSIEQPCHTTFVKAIALGIGLLLLGAVADSLRRNGKNIETLLAIIAAVFMQPNSR